MTRLEDDKAFLLVPQKLNAEDKQLLEPFQYPEDDRGLIEEELNRLLKVADALGLLVEKPDEISSKIKTCSKDPPAYLKPSEVASYSPTQLLHSFATIFRRMLLKFVAFPPVPMPPRELPNHYPHKSVPEHARQVVAEGKAQVPKNGVVFDSSHAKLLFDALSNPNHQHRQRAVQLVRRFGAAVEKEKALAHIKEQGIVVQQASRKYGIPENILREWGVMDLIPVLYKGKGKQGVYLDEDAVARAAALYQEAKQKGIQPTRLLKAEIDQQAETRPQLDQGITASAASREFKVPTNFLLRWAKELDVIPIISEGTGAGSATYLDREKAREVAELYHEAKRQKTQPIKLYQRMSAANS